MINDAQSKIAAAVAVLAQATGVGLPPVEPLSMILNTAPHLVFALAVYYMMVRENEKHKQAVDSLSTGFRETLEQIADRSEKQADSFIKEFKDQAAQDRSTHQQLFGELAQLTREQMAINSATKGELLALTGRMERFLAEGEVRRRSDLPPPAPGAASRQDPRA